MNKSSRQFATALILVLLFGWHCRARAAQVTVDFEAFDGVDYVSNEPVPETAKLSNQLASAYGIVFRSEGTKPYVGVVPLPSSFTNTPGGTGAIVAVDENDILSYRTPVVVEFVRPSDPSIAATTDFVSIRGILAPKDGD